MEQKSELDVLTFSPAKLAENILSQEGWTQQALADALKTTQPTISRWITGKSKPSFEEGFALYALYNNIISGQGSIADISSIKAELVPQKKTARFFGRVGAGAMVYMPDDMDGPIDWVDVPPVVPDGVGCVEIEGDSMFPRYFHGERLFF